MTTEDEFQEARMEGKWAFRDGYRLEDNPYMQGTALHRAWGMGWRMEERDCEGS